MWRRIGEVVTVCPPYSASSSSFCRTWMDFWCRQHWVAVLSPRYKSAIECEQMWVNLATNNEESQLVGLPGLAFLLESKGNRRCRLQRSGRWWTQAGWPREAFGVQSPSSGSLDWYIDRWKLQFCSQWLTPCWKFSKVLTK